MHTYHPGVRPLAAALALAAAILLTLAPGRAAASAPAVFVGNGGTRSVPAFDATGAPAAGFTAPAGFTDLGGIAYNPANQTLYRPFTSPTPPPTRSAPSTLAPARRPSLASATPSA